MSDTVADELVAALESDADICELVWDLVAHEARIYPQSRVQDGRKQIEKLPAIIYDLQGQGESRASACDLTLRRQVWRMVVFAGRYEELEELARAVARVLPDPEKWGPLIRELIVLGQSDDFEDETNTHERQIDLSVLAWS